MQIKFFSREILDSKLQLNSVFRRIYGFLAQKVTKLITRYYLYTWQFIIQYIKSVNLLDVKLL